jgi:hypothetical protein
VAQKIRTAGDRLTRALNEIQRRAPEARLYVVGYPSILPAKGTRCGRSLPLGRRAGDRQNTHLTRQSLAD